MQHLQEIPISISCESAKFECTVSSYEEMFLAIESSRQHVIKRLNYTTLQLFVNFIYTGKIVVTEKNVQVLIPATNLLQLNDVNKTCCAFLQKQLHPENCLGIKLMLIYTAAQNY